MQHSVSEKQGRKELDPVWNHLLSKEQVLNTSGLPPALQEIDVRSYTPTFVRHWFEADVTGSLRLVTPESVAPQWPHATQLRRL